MDGTAERLTDGIAERLTKGTAERVKAGTAGAAASAAAPVAADAPRPTRLLQFWNLVVVHLAWFAAVLGAAHHLPLLGTAAVLASLGWHLAVSARWRVEARLLAAVLLIGLAVESATAPLQLVRFTSGQLAVGTAPYWMVGLWGVLAIALNVTMRWLKGRWLLAAIAGGIVGPFSYVSGVGLGAATFVKETPMVVLLAVLWAVLMPLLMWLSNRWDGVAVPEPAGPPPADASLTRTSPR